MKQLKRSFSVELAETAATFFYENSIIVILSWLEESFLSTKINVILIAPAESIDLLNMQSFLRK